MIELATALVLLLTAILGYLARQVNEVHVLVNRRAEEQRQRIDQLIKALVDAKEIVPADPALKEEGGVGDARASRQ